MTKALGTQLVSPVVTCHLLAFSIHRENVVLPKKKKKIEKSKQKPLDSRQPQWTYLSVDIEAVITTTWPLVT